ncbi:MULTISPECIES: DUF1003 domain-containing protein [Cyanophyceae]|uniref:DUF1003 domain-containing protein n=1 Tax=Stenomitos frigidus AS-A4 TaxID=2933935 RepID=A0ABV0KM58_9CYAN|nr:DUF1003 domain-containing protein [Phormidium sp. FACHB-592]
MMKVEANNEHPAVGLTEFNFQAHPQRVLTAPLPDPIAQSIDAIISLHRQEAQDLPAHQKSLEQISTFFGQPKFLYSLLAGFLFWISGSLLSQAGLLPPFLPPFQWSQEGLDMAALLISTGVLVRQSRQEKFAEQRSQLMLQLNLLSEQKLAKVIALLEELRTDLPNVIDRPDLEAQAMQTAADPIEVLDALQENLAQELATDVATDALKPK